MDDTQIEMLPMLGEFSSIASQYEHIMFYYESGIQQIVAKLQILNNEFKNNHERNPIENIKSRVKSLDSIIDKMKRKGIPLTTNAMKREIKDIAGVRVICPFISDVYQVANMLVNQADVEIVTIKDYIKKPKENGYRSLHMIVLVDVYFSDHKDKVPIEIQFRTIAMNFWASTEHQLRYKKSRIFTEEMQQELKYIQQEVGITFIFVTHDQEEALTMSDKIVVMNAGEIQQIGTPTEIYRTPVNEFVAKFIGETNIIDGVMLEDDLVMFEDKKYACRARGYNKNEKVDVVIRPEHLDIVPRAEGMLKGTVKSQLFKGMHYETVVETRVGTSITVKMQVSQDRPVYNEEKGEKISANAFLLDVEDVEELDDAKVVALASAEAWDAETEEPISIKTVEYDIKPETGNYTVTFATANDTSITVKVLVVAQNRVESKVYQEEIYAMNFFKKVEDIQESIALDTDLETWASASAWSLEDGEQVEITDVKYDFDPETITPGVYDVTFSTEGYEYKVSTTHAFEEGEQVGLVFRAEDIHVMKKEGQW